MRSKGPWLVVLLAIAGVAAWALLRPSAGPDVAGGGDAADREGAAPGVPAPTTLAGAGGRANGGPGRASPRGDLRGRSTIVGTVRRGGAPSAARVEVRPTMPVEAGQAMARGPAAFFASVVAAPIALEPAAVVVKAGDDGRFTVEGLASGAWHVRAIAADGATGSAQVGIAADGARVGVEVALDAGTETLVGRVVHADGSPFRGLVTVDRSTGRGEFAILFSAGEPLEVDATGAFRASGLEPGAYVVSAVEVGLLRAVGRPVVVPTTAPYVLTLPAASRVVEGRVAVDLTGEPIAGAELLAGGRGEGDVDVLVARATSDATGAFRIAVTPGSDRAIVASATGFTTTLVPLPAGQTQAVDVRLLRGGTITGRVTADPDGRPVRGLHVTAMSLGRGAPFGREPAITDADGRYTLDGVAPGGAIVTASGDGWVPKAAGDASGGYQPLAVSVTPGGHATFDLVVTRGARLAGAVFGADGSPVAGAVVRAEGRGDAVAMRAPGAGPVTATGADGLFLLDGLVADAPYDVVVSALGAADARVGPTVATTATTPPRVEVRLVAPRAVEITVVEAESNAPVVGALVSVSAGDGPGGRSRAATDGRGVAKVEVPPAVAATVHVSHDDFLRAEPAALAAGGDRLTVTLRRALSITGVLVDGDGAPVPETRVSATSTGRWVRPVATDGAGRFRLTGLEPGTYDLEARVLRESKVGLVATARCVAGATGVELRLARPEGQASGLLVRVVGADGKPVPRASVRVVFGERGSSGATAEDGLAIVDVSGREGGLVGATVTASRPRSIAGQPLPFGAATIGPLVGSEVEVEVRLPPEKVVSGVLLDPDGKPVRGAVVVAADATQASNLSWAFRDEQSDLPRARTDAEGRFRLGGLGDEEVEVFVAPPPEFPTPDPVKARGGTSDLVITLTAGLAATVTVLDEAGAPVAGASVTTSALAERRPGEASRAPLDGPRARADASGVARLRGFDARRRYHFAVNGPGEGWLQHAVADWSPKDVTVRLARALTVTGTVRDPEGKPLRGIMVFRATGENGWHGTGVTDAEGRFEVRDLAAGEVVLRAAVRNAGAAEPGPGLAEARVRAGATGVVLTLDPGLELVLRLADPAAVGASAAVQVVVVGEDGRNRDTSFVRFEADGVGRLRGLAPTDRCIVWMAPDREGRVFLARDARPGAEVVVAPKPGLRITGRMTVPAGATDVQVSAQLEDLWIGVQGTRAPDGAFELRGLPEGTTWQLNGTCRVEGRWVTTRGPAVAAGGQGSFDLKEAR
ncbi:MAG: carboxypeptidase-like regulatory domain-containing protein [Planctomycetota bacterium]